jgi:hypothetical protein
MLLGLDFLMEIGGVVDVEKGDTQWTKDGGRGVTFECGEHVASDRKVGRRKGQEWITQYEDGISKVEWLDKFKSIIRP